jgi:hypothetical protein
MIRDLTGVRIERLPPLELAPFSRNTLAYLLDDPLESARIGVCGAGNLEIDRIGHEMFHLAQSLTRGRSWSRCYSSGFVALAGDPESAPHAELKRTSVLLDGANEAGARLFGSYVSFDRGSGQTDVGANLIDNLRRCNGARTSKLYRAVDIVFDGSAKIPIRSRAMVEVAIAINSIVLDMHEMDVKAASTQLLSDPLEVLEKVRREGKAEARKGIRRTALLVHSLRG